MALVHVYMQSFTVYSMTVSYDNKISNKEMKLVAAVFSYM